MRVQPAHAAPAVIAPRVRANPWIVLLVLTLGYFMILLDTSIVNVALPDMERDLHAAFDQILWVVNSYVLVFAVLLITAGRLGDLFGPRRLFVAGLALFTLASAACGLAHDAGQLILFRGLQGVGGAIMTPQTLAILATIFPPARRGTAFGVLGSVAGLAVVVGPTLGAGWSPPTAGRPSSTSTSPSASRPSWPPSSWCRRSARIARPDWICREWPWPRADC